MTTPAALPSDDDTRRYSECLRELETLRQQLADSERTVAELRAQIDALIEDEQHNAKVCDEWKKRAEAAEAELARVKK